jgi:hypothetical protein
MRLLVLVMLSAVLASGCASTPGQNALARLGTSIQLTPEQTRAIHLGMTRFHRGPEALRLGDVRAVRTDGGAIQVCGYAYTGGQTRTEFAGVFPTEQSRDVALEVPSSDDQRREIAATCAAKGLTL